jgi:hypothetical protein
MYLAAKAGLNDRQKKALIYLVENPRIRRSKYVEMYRAFLRTAKRELNIPSKPAEGRGRRFIYYYPKMDND